MSPHLTIPSLLAPAGDWECARAALANGADAIYFGLEQFNARMRAENFTSADLPELMGYLHQRGVKGYLTLNTLIFPQELPQVENYLRHAIAAGVDAVIVQDIGLCRLIRHLSSDWPIHASTQMTITSAAGIEFARDLGCNLVVLARECSIAEIDRLHSSLGDRGLPLEIFVHGALCVAYSGQCLTSEALGGRSANRGECAQACRLPYQLQADGRRVDLGDRAYLLSPQDLAGIDLLPQIVQAGVSCLKIEGRLKTPEYVASVTRAYRQALDRLAQPDTPPAPAAQRYELEMAFSRGLSPGWLAGIDNQALVPAEFSNKRGSYAGTVVAIEGRVVIVRAELELKAGDGVLFATGQRSQGGRIYTVQPHRGDTLALAFDWQNFDLSQVAVGDRLWKTSDPELSKQIRHSYQGDRHYTQPLHWQVQGRVGTPLQVTAQDSQGHQATATSAMPLEPAQNQPLTIAKLQAQLNRLGGTPFHGGQITVDLAVDAILPISELNRLRRSVLEEILSQRRQPPAWHLSTTASWADLLPPPTLPPVAPVQLHVLVRSLEQLQGALDRGIGQIYGEFSNPADYRTAGDMTRDREFFAVPPRITKPGEHWTLTQLASSHPAGYVVRNYDQLAYFRGQRSIGDFSLNIANGLTGQYFHSLGLERLTAAYDLNISQMLDLVSSDPTLPWEVTLHQHMPMFHMEHCVFCAFLSDGHDYRDCGRPCDRHQVTLQDRVGSSHILQADVGCRNTVFNSVAQTGAEYWQVLVGAGVRHFRLELLREDQGQTRATIQAYQDLLASRITGRELWQRLQLRHQLGVTRGTLGG